MHFEFIGLPGSGKTTLYKEIMKKINTRGIKKKKNLKHYEPELCYFLAENTALTQLFIQKVIARQFPNDEKEFLIRNFFKLFACYHVLKNSVQRKEVFLFDEGFCHKAISLFGFGEGGLDEEGNYAYL